MPRTGTRRAEGTVRKVEPPAAPHTADIPFGQLHRPVPQLTELPPAFDIEYLYFSPQMATQWLDNARQADGFRQRPLRLAEARRWKNVIQTQRFVHFLPNQAICENEHGVLINGQHRLTGLSQCPDDTVAGFMVIRKVPRWMFAFFDTNKGRTLKDVFHIGTRQSDPQTGSAMKLGMRYEEFLLGKRSPGGWRHWNIVKDEHQDVDDFYARREELQDWYALGSQVYQRARLLIPSVMVFSFYQSLAWPEGDPDVLDFIEQLKNASKLSPEHPARLLRQWTSEAYMHHQQVFAKRETHLMLIMQAFERSMRGGRYQRLQWAYGQPMSVPYHPKGPEVAVKNVRLALEDIDREFTP